MKLPALWLGLAFVSGIATARFLSTRPTLWITVATLSILIGLLLAFRSNKFAAAGICALARNAWAAIDPEIDVGEQVVSPYLWSRGVKKLDVVLLSHAHHDHIDGL